MFFRSLPIIVALLFSGAAFAQKESNCIHDNNHFRCVQYLYNYDGDTVTFNIPNIHPLLGHKIPVRIVGLDTPEIKGNKPCEKEKARTAKKLIESKLKNAKVIHLLNVDRDKYFRILAEVEVDGERLSALLLKNKLAVPYQGGKKTTTSWCEHKP